MIITLTLNPAIDESIIVDSIKINNINTTKSVYICAGGKGINVAKGLAKLQKKHKSIILNKDLYFEELLKKDNINYDFIYTDIYIRHNIKIIDRINNTCTDLNEKGKINDKNILEKVKSKLDSIDFEYLCLSGSIPDGMDKKIYINIINYFKNKKIILDTSGIALKSVLDSDVNLFVIKPNIYELEEYANKKLNNIDEVIYFAKTLLNKVRHIFISLGEEGFIYISANNIYCCQVPKVNPLNTVGAGDTMVASIIAGFSNKNYKIEDILRYAASASVQSVLLEDNSFPDIEDIDKNLDKIGIKKYDK